MTTRTPVPGEALTRRAVTVITTLIAIMTFLFSFGNVTELCLRLGITPAIAWPIGAAVDLSVVGLLAGVRFLSMHGYTDAQLRKPRRMLLFCGFLTLALNTSDALSRRHVGTALVDAVGPVLLIGWSEVGPWMLRQIYTVSAQPEPVPSTKTPTSAPVISGELIARARELDTQHRALTGRPISRDTLRAELRIGRDRASALIKIVRTAMTSADLAAAA